MPRLLAGITNYVGATKPRVLIEVDFVNDPTSLTETWTDITAYVRTKTTGAELMSTDRGRTYELSRTESGRILLVLDNTDGRFDPTNMNSPYRTGTGNPAGTPGLVTADRRVRVQAIWGNLTYQLFRGNIEDWPQTWSDGGFYGMSMAAGYDAFSALAAIDLEALPIIEVIKDAPVALYRLNDASTGASAGNSSATNQPNAVITAGPSVTGATYGFGGTSGSGALSADPSSSLAFTGNWNSGRGVNDGGYVLKLADLGQGPLLRLGGWAVELWFRSKENVKNTAGTMFAQSDGTNANPQVQLNLLAVAGGFAPVINIIPSGPPASVGVAGAVNICDDAWHHIVANLATDNKTVTLYTDGALSGTAVAANPVTWNPPRNAFLGGYMNSASFLDGFITGEMKNVAIYTAPLPAERVLAHFQAAAGWAGEKSDVRLNRLLDAAAWPTSQRNITAGDSAVGSQATEGQKCLASMQLVNDTEAGNLYVDSQGRPSFRARSARYNTASVATFGEQENPYQGDLEMRLDPKDVYNNVTVSRTAGVSVRAIDSASQVRYFPRSLLLSTIAADDPSVLYLAEYLLDRYKTPHLRVPQLTLIPTENLSLWPQCLGREIGDRITVTRRPGGATTISKDFFIEKVSIRVTAEEWKFTWLLSPAETSDYFVLDSGTFGRLSGASTLNAAMTSAQTTLVTPDAIFNASDVPYDVVVDAEQMTVTAASTPGTAPQTLTVTRGVHSTTAAAHASGAVVSLAPSYSYGLTY